MSENLADDPEQRRLSERCLGSHAGPPILPTSDTNFVRLVQTSEYVVIAAEASGDARIVPIDGHREAPAGISTWRGASLGRWEGDTLVVETRNVRSGAGLPSTRAVTGPAFHLVERFTVTDADGLLYEFTVDDPDTFVRPWTAVLPMSRSRSRMFEYACHEGNRALEGILRGARYEEGHRPAPAGPPRGPVP